MDEGDSDDAIIHINLRPQLVDEGVRVEVAVANTNL